MNVDLKPINPFSTGTLKTVFFVPSLNAGTGATI